MSTTSTRTVDAPARSAASPLYSALIGLASLAVLLQGLWAGVFIGKGRSGGEAESWVTAHARGGEVAIVLTVLAFVVAFATMRSRRDLLIGTGLLAVLLVLESYLGGLVSDEEKNGLLAVHIPLAMALMGLVVWLPLRARSRA